MVKEYIQIRFFIFGSKQATEALEAFEALRIIAKGS